MSGRPGVFHKEADISQVVTGGSTTVAGICGDAKWGPPEELTLVSSSDQFVQLFGKPTSPAVTPMHYQAFGYFQRGNSIWVVRPVDSGTHYGAAGSTAGAALAEGSGSATRSVGSTDFTIFTKYPGVYDGGDIYAETADGSGNDFTLRLGSTLTGTDLDPTGLDFESHRVSLDTEAVDGFGRTMYLPNVLDRDSLLASALVDHTTTPVIPADPAQAIKLNGQAFVAVGSGLALSGGGSAYTLFHSKSAVTVDLLIPGDFDSTTLNDIVTAAETRGDCMAILSPGVNETFSTAGMTTWLGNITSKPWASVGYGSLVKVRDNYNDTDVIVPSAGFVAGAYAYTDQIAAPWFAPAGPRRARINVKSLDTNWLDSEQDTLYDQRLNFLTSSPRYGVTVQGQKTLYGVESAMQRVNVARLILKLKRDLLAYLEDYMYEFNNDLNRTLISSGVSSYLQFIKSGQGLYDFRVVCDETNNTSQVIDSNKLVVDVYLKPVRAAEFLYLKTIVTSSGVNFDDLIALGA